MKAIKGSFALGEKLVAELKANQLDNIEKAAQLIVQAHADHHQFFVSGSGHSHCVAEELYGRAGSLAFTIPIITDELTLTAHPTKSSYIENLTGYAHILAQLYKIEAGDVVLIASNSGRNAYPVELADEAKKRGAKVIAITNMKHTLNASPRNQLKKRLYELADVVIDNCGEVGDAALKVEGVDTLICPTSSIANSFICSALAAGVAEHLVGLGIKPEVFVSANVDGGFEKNQKLMDKYARMYYK